MSESVFDPGRKWRRRVRWGALLCFLGTLVPLGINTIWSAWDGIWRVAIDATQQGALIVFCCLSVPAMFSGPIMLIAARPAKAAYEKRSWLSVGLTGALFFASVAPPCYFFGFHIKQFTQDEAPAILGIVGFILFLAAAGLCALHARDKRQGPLCIFPLGILPLSMAMIAWFAVAIHLIFELFVNFLEWRFPVFTIMTCAGSTLQFVSWLFWWRAVKKETAALTTPSPPAPASSTSSPA